MHCQQQQFSRTTVRYSYGCNFLFKLLYLYNYICGYKLIYLCNLLYAAFIPFSG
jgi:hypothetical protein